MPSPPAVTMIAGVGLLFATIARDVIAEQPMHAVGGSHLLAILGLAIGLVQQRAASGARWDSALAWLYVTGVTSHVVMHDVTWSDGPPWDWRFAYVPFALILISIVGAAVRAGGRLGGAPVAVRIYLLGGLIVCALHLALLIVAGVFALGFGGIAGFNIASFWYPMAMVLAMASIGFGVMPEHARPGTNVAALYVIGATLVSVGSVWASNDAFVSSGSSAVMLAGLIAIAPSFGLSIVRLSRANPSGSDGEDLSRG